MATLFGDELWRRAVEAAGLTEHSELLRAEARPCFWLDGPVRDRYRKVGHSRLGGDPDLPRGFDWPVTGDGPMTFLAQINLAQLQPAHVPELPGQGWLYFFLGSERAEYDLSHRVLYYDGSAAQLVRTRPPKRAIPIDPRRQFVAYKVELYPIFTLSPESPVWEELGVENPPWYLVTEGATQLGGHAVTWAGDPADNAYLSRNGFGPLVGLATESPAWLDRTEERLRRGLEQTQAAGQSSQRLDESLAALRRYRPDLERHRRGVAEWRLLFILASDEEMGMNWGDMGLLQFLIHEQDLQACRFDNTYCELTTS
ncbi:MAG: DUF1963 domain-containing protein [Chloroflexota bacterium]